MSQIGSFTATKDGGWSGTVHTLTIETKVRLVPNDNRESDQAPAFRVFAGKSEIGAAWPQRSGGEPPKEYLSVRLDDPSWLEPVTAALFTDTEGKEAKLVWSRRRSGT
ncbi:MAG: DUF736 domain-containing protein [Alphaproteobacteria bacterium]|nr:DUF736 domain-containing protein [Alphaproteobacteria bacterium]